jgi:hypothetical protein
MNGMDEVVTACSLVWGSRMDAQFRSRAFSFSMRVFLSVSGGVVGCRDRFRWGSRPDAVASRRARARVCGPLLAAITRGDGAALPRVVWESWRRGLVLAQL